MSNKDANDGGSRFVFCRSCGTKASADWSFCRACESSLDDAVPPERRRDLASKLFVGAGHAGGDPGCTKCGRTDPQVDLLETTGVAVTPRVAAQNDRFRVVSCSHCGYAEFYTHGDEEMVAELFLKG